MPEKLNTTIAKHGGASLTPCLKFQLSLARVYLQNATLVLIDEQPDAVLKGETGNLLKKYIEQSKGKRSIVMTTARRDFLQLADQVLLIHPSRKPMQGTFDELEHHNNTTQQLALRTHEGHLKGSGRVRPLNNLSGGSKS